MKAYTDIFNTVLTEDVRDMLMHIREPKIVATALADARRAMTLLPNGELREYGRIHSTALHGAGGQKAYLSSLDCGISWTLHYDRGDMGPCLYIPEKGLYIKAVAKEGKTYIKRSAIGPDDPSPKEHVISDKFYFCEFLPQKCEKSDRIFFTAQRKREDGINLPVFLYSDDFGESFTAVELPAPPKHEPTYPHKGVRWSISNGSEPCAVELGNGRMMMLIRTSTDYFYQSFSEDGGESWSEMTPSPFHGTNTTPFLLRLSDGRILALWNNTQPLPEEDHEHQMPPLPENIKNGYWEDVFTNRDAAHAAISEDGGRTWIGYREIYLNPIRNASDFRYAGGKFDAFDKSVHQFQAIELPMGKILVAAGQNATCRRLMIFDLDWLYESERKEDFLSGLANVTTHLYLKSIAGSTMEYGNGHCSYNRITGAVMMADPEGGYLECAYISHNKDARLLEGMQGIVWNFPASQCGRVETELYLTGSGARIALSDRHFNACDRFAAELSPFGIDLSEKEIPQKRFVTLAIEYNTEKGSATLWIGEKEIAVLPMRECIESGISYLCIQYPYEDEGGIYLKSLSKKSL